MTDEKLRELATVLIKKLDVALPEINGFVAFTSTRAGMRGYMGPAFHEEIEGIREILGLPNPAALPKEFYPPDHCKRCEGEGRVLGETGIPDRFTKMNIGPMAVEIINREVAIEKLMDICGWSEKLANKQLNRLPLQLRVTAVYDEEQRGPLMISEDSVQSLKDCLKIEIRRRDWDMPPDKKTKDICPDCKGTGGRGLPKAWGVEDD